MDDLPNKDSLNSQYPPLDNGLLTSPWVSNYSNPSQASEYAEDRSDMSQIQNTTTNESVPHHYGHRNINQSPYQSTTIHNRYAAADPNRVGAGHFSQASQYSNIDPVLLRQSWTSDEQCHDHASYLDMQSNTYTNPAGQRSSDNMPAQRWANSSYDVGGFGLPPDDIHVAQLPEARQDGLQTYVYDPRYSQTQQLQQQPIDRPVSGLANLDHFSARPPADSAGLVGAPAASIGASSLILHGGVGELDGSSTSPEPQSSREPPAVVRRRLSTWGRSVGRPLSTELQTFLDVFRTLTMNGARPSRTQLRDSTFRKHFTHAGRLRRYSTLMDYYGDTRIFPLALWRYLADYIEEDG